MGLKPLKENVLNFAIGSNQVNQTRFVKITLISFFFFHWKNGEVVKSEGNAVQNSDKKISVMREKSARNMISVSCVCPNFIMS